MSLLSNTRSKRRTVLSVFLVWLFALASSWANACFFQDPGTHLDRAAKGAAHGAHPSIGLAGHVGVAIHIPSFDSGKDAQVKDCADEIQTIVKLPSTINLIDVAMAPPIALAWAAHSTATTADRWVLALPGPSPVLPLRTRFSRLAL